MVKPPKPTDPLLNSQVEDWWINTLRWLALGIFIALPIFAYFFQSIAGRVVWTMVVAALPLFIVLVGYHRWRRICPLAFFAQIPVRWRRPGTRRASAWLEANYYLVAFGVFFFSLWMRLIATNGDGHAIAVFFILLALVAFIFGALFTGKTWCNHFCPVSFIEKIYTEPQGLSETENSQCEKCSACKKFCPDISEENGYWKEISSRSKRIVYFAFPGIVFGFYFYYYLQAGNWDYYFGGSWTNQPGLVYRAFLPGYDRTTAGFFFFPAAPRALASILTLALCALASLLLFTVLERAVGYWLTRRDAETDSTRVRHVMFSVAAFTAFITFYSFAGQPSLRKIHFFPASHLVLIAVILTAPSFWLPACGAPRRTLPKRPWRAISSNDGNGRTSGHQKTYTRLSCCTPFVHAKVPRSPRRFLKSTRMPCARRSRTVLSLAKPCGRLKTCAINCESRSLIMKRL